MSRRLKTQIAAAAVVFGSIFCLPVVSGGETVRGTESKTVTRIKDASSPLEHLETSEVLRDILVWNEAVEQYKFHKVVTTAYERNLAQWQKIQEEKARKAEAAKVVAVKRQSQAPAPQISTGRCGGDLPPCYVMMRESGGNIRAENPTSTASGKWQFLDSTWGGFGGYSHASYAPESVQDARARQLWAGGAGCGHWLACG